MENHPFLKLQKILLEEDNKYATEQLILASLFMMVFESFKGFMNDKIEYFFSDGFTTNDLPPKFNPDVSRVFHHL